MKLKVFRDLEFYGNENSFLQLIETIEKKLSDGWKRNHEDEKKMSASLSKTVYTFECDKSGQRESAYLSLTTKNATTLYVPNIVPVESGRLEIDQYNYVLTEFYEKFAKSAADELKLEHKLTDDVKGIDNWVSPNVEKKLTRFSRLANKGTGSAHPSDEERWFDFIISAHQENSSLSSETLRRWLTEVEGWSAEISWDLVIEYESARRLLKFYDENPYAN